jgi:SagB-type dehydrogenase family enzyme
LKTSPSGGARHAIELYVASLRIDGVPRGLYHYAPDKHALVLLRNGSTEDDVERYLPTQWWYRQTGAIVFFSAVFSRELWRYDYARAYRALFIEAGHLCQTFCLTATWLGLAPFCSMALADSVIESDLRLDGITESVLYAAGVGTRPSAAKWIPPTTTAGKPTKLTRAAVRQFPGRLPRTPRARRSPG